jgi:hypothetical protein
MTARLRDELEKECQTEAEKLELRANTFFQETSDMKKVQMRASVNGRTTKQVTPSSPHATDSWEDSSHTGNSVVVCKQFARMVPSDP